MIITLAQFPSFFLFSKITKILWFSYGFSALRQDLMKNVKVVDKEGLADRVRNKNFVSTVGMGSPEDAHLLNEITTRKSHIKMTSPVQLAAEILGGAKKVMLEFIYGFLDRVLDPKHWCTLYMDT